MLPVWPGNHLGILIRPLLQCSRPILGFQLEIPLRLQLIQEFDGPLAGLGILLEQLVPLLLDPSGRLLVLLHPRR